MYHYPPPIQPIRSQSQRGFLLESLGLVLFILSVLALLQMNKSYEEDLDNEATRYGQTLMTVRNVANDYLISYSSELLALTDMNEPMTVTTGSGETITIDRGGFPRVDELVRLGKTPPNLLPNAIDGSSYIIRIEKVPAGCDTLECNLEGLVLIDRPYLNNGEVDYARLGIAAGVIGSDSAFSKATSARELSGYGGLWSTTNPVLNQPAGILAARFGYASSIFAEFYKRDGSTPLTGDMPAAGHAINDVSTLTATGKVTAKNFITATYNANDACDVADENAFASGTSGAMMVCSTGRWKYAKHNPVALGAVCSPEGITGTSTATEETLICKGGIYVRLNNLIAKNVQVGRMLVQDGQIFSRPACEAGGQPDNSILINKTSIDMANLDPMQAFEAAVFSAGTNWQASIKLIDTHGNRHSATPYAIFATVNLECKYN